MHARSSSGLVVVVLAALAPACSRKVADDPLKGLEGAWLIVELHDNGKRADIDKRQRPTLLFRNGKCYRTDPNLTLENSVVQADNSKSPGTMDFINLDSGKTKMGIFVLEGDKLKICQAAPGEARPTDFTAAQNVTLMILERVQQRPANP